MIIINDRKIEEKLSQLRKAIEIVGGKEYLADKFSKDEDLLVYILNSFFDSGYKCINIIGKEYSMNELFKIKIEYEKHILKNKSKTIESIVFKIKKYDTKLDSLIRKYKKSKNTGEYNVITELITEKYRKDINGLILNEIDSIIVESLDINKEENKYYGEYLSQKRKALVDFVISKLGIV